MFAVIKTGGKQYKVHEGDTLRVEKLPYEANTKQTLTEVLCYADDKKIVIEMDKLKNASVEYTVLGPCKGEKIIVFKKKRRKNHRKKIGHRQHFTMIQINKFNF